MPCGLVLFNKPRRLQWWTEGFAPHAIAMLRQLRQVLPGTAVGAPPAAWGRPGARTTGPACGIQTRSSADPGEKKSTQRGGRLPSGLAQDSIVLKLEKHSQVSLVQKCRILHGILIGTQRNSWPRTSL